MGIELAKGEYISFMDPDDLYFQKTALEILYQASLEQNADMCGGNISSLNSNYINNKFAYRSYFHKKEFFDSTFVPVQDGFFWRFLFQRQFLIKNRLSFPNYLRAQDPVFYLNCLVCKPRIQIVPEHIYLYRLGHKNIKWDGNKLRDWLYSLRDIIKICNINNYSELLYYKIKWVKSEWPVIIDESIKCKLNINSIVFEINNLINWEAVSKMNKSTVLPLKTKRNFDSEYTKFKNRSKKLRKRIKSFFINLFFNPLQT